MRRGREERERRRDGENEGVRKGRVERRIEAEGNGGMDRRRKKCKGWMKEMTLLS